MSIFTRMSLLRPAVFQGSTRRRRYFEGWYHKHVSADGQQVRAFIPGISLTPDDRHAFVQTIDGRTNRTSYVRYPLEEFSFDRARYAVQVGANRFSSDGMELDLDDGDTRYRGALQYHNSTPFPRRLLSPGIMGWYTFVPRMECYHGVVSADHTLSGSLEIGEATLSFDGGRGYIEKDWGRSFPKAWVWLQCNGFLHPGTSLMLSIAQIPWMGRWFLGFLGFLYRDGVYEVFATYNGARITDIEAGDDRLRIGLVRESAVISIDAQVTAGGALKAPIEGKMDRVIKESVDATVSFRFLDPLSRRAWHDTGSNGGLEVVEPIVGLVRQEIRKR